MTHDARPARLLQAAPIKPVVRPAGADGRDQLSTIPRRSPRRSRSWSISHCINEGECGFAVGAVNVRTGNFIYFDNAKETIGPSMSWPAARCRRRCRWSRSARDHFWDGGIVSNTPLQHLLDEDDDIDTTGLPGRSVQRARRAAARPQ